jgi:hypothetical protein
MNNKRKKKKKRASIDKLDCMDLKTFGTTKEMVFKLKMLPTEWEIIFVGYTSDKG